MGKYIGKEGKIRIRDCLTFKSRLTLLCTSHF